jgi:S-adenosylmethionine:tRNA ribosyltransferase-isomerase
MTRLDLFDYELPRERVAQYPSERRDGSRLLVIDRVTGALRDRHFADLPEYLREGDVLVLNDSRVMHARLLGVKQKTGARVELFLLRRVTEPVLNRAAESEYGLTGEGDLIFDDSLNRAVAHSSEIWEALARPARRLKAGDTLCFGDELVARVIRKTKEGSLIVSLTCAGVFSEALKRVGKVPLPPYIRREAQAVDAERYQTVYANEAGSAAAPTAGLHFTTDLLDNLRRQGVRTAFVTLHVGLGTFRPVQSEIIEDHRMHREFYHVSEQAAATVNTAKREGRRVVCVGTTSVRALESVATLGLDAVCAIEPGWGDTNIFIYPGGRDFLVTDALITNFHLPKSTLLMLVSAFYSREGILAAYSHAIQADYRFFSYGDSMLIL